MLLNPGRWLLWIAAVATLVIGYGQWAEHIRSQGRAEIQARWDADRLQWQAAIARQQAEAGATLAAAESRARATERRLRDLRDQQERTDEAHQAVVADLGRRLAAAILRDPGDTPATGGGGGGGGQAGQPASGADPGAPDGAHAGRPLSERLAGLLRRLAAEADRINDAYASCRADAMNIRAQHPAAKDPSP